MQLVSFHLMPYRPLNLAEAAKHRSPWVVLPNRLYDPVKGAEEYARHIDALVYAGSWALMRSASTSITRPPTG
jgi:hypothetical protein